MTTTLEEIPAWAALTTAVFLVLGSGLAMIGSFGLLRFKTFYERVHAPTLGTTMGLVCILVASAIYFSVSQTRPVVHEILIAVFITTTTPVTFVLLVQASLYRDRAEGKDLIADAQKTPPPA